MRPANATAHMPKNTCLRIVPMRRGHRKRGRSRNVEQLRDCSLYSVSGVWARSSGHPVLGWIDRHNAGGDRGTRLIVYEYTAYSPKHSNTVPSELLPRI